MKNLTQILLLPVLCFVSLLSLTTEAEAADSAYSWVGEQTAAGITIEVGVLNGYQYDWQMWEILAMAASYTGEYPEAVLDWHATKWHNCHAYAWLGVANRWLNGRNQDGWDQWDEIHDLIYVPRFSCASWQSFSSAEIQEMLGWFGSRVYYQTPSQEFWHAALWVSGEDGQWVVSKWGDGPRFRHRVAHCPYAGAELVVYEQIW